MSEEPQPPRVLNGRYELRSTLGRGGMGVVYDAWDQKLDRSVAVKMIPGLMLMMGGSEDVKRRFAIEAQACSRIDNAHVVRILDFGVEGEHEAYLVMERLHGETLDDMRQRVGRVPVNLAAHIGTQICEALQAAHGSDVVHRDLKPANIMLVDNEEAPFFVKVLDFGVAKLLDGEDITATGMMMGTPDYIAPELILGGRPTPRSDVYSIGVLLYRVITGTRIFRKNTAVAGFHNVNSMPQAMRERSPSVDVPPQLDALVLRCLSKDPNARFASMSEVAEALRPFATGPFVMPPPRVDAGGDDQDDLSPTERAADSLANLSTALKSARGSQDTAHAAALPPPAVASADAPATELVNPASLAGSTVEQGPVTSLPSATLEGSKTLSLPQEPSSASSESAPPSPESMSGAFFAETALLEAPASTSLGPRLAAAAALMLVLAGLLFTFLGREQDEEVASKETAGAKAAAPTTDPPEPPPQKASAPVPPATNGEGTPGSHIKAADLTPPTEVRAPERVRSKPKRLKRRRRRRTPRVRAPKPPKAKPRKATPPKASAPGFERVRTQRN